MRRVVLGALLCAAGACSKNMTLDVSISGKGIFQAFGPGSANPDIVCDEKTVDCGGHLPAGSSVHLQAVAEPFSHFDGWSSTDLAGLVDTDPDQMITVGGEGTTQHLTLTFAPDPTLAIALTGKGKVTSSAVGPSMISCPTACTSAFPLNTKLTLTALPDPGQKLESWTITPALAGFDPSVTSQQITLATDEIVHATFVPDEVICHPADTETVAPSVTSIDTTGTVCSGDTIQVSGTDLAGGASCATVNGLEVSLVEGNETTLVLTLAPGTPTGDVDVTVVTSQGQSMLSTGTLAISSGTLPTVTTFSPTTSPPNGTIMINGTSLDNATVTLVGSPGTFTASLVGDTGMKITAIVPPGTPVGSYLVTVTTPCGSANAVEQLSVD